MRPAPPAAAETVSRLPSAEAPPAARVFCFLQGPHGPFFPELADAMGHLGHRTLRIGFNAGDERAWGDRPYRAYREDADAWMRDAPVWLAEDGVTDLVLYGDARAYHAHAIAAARRLGLRVHTFEEGYLRPYWITYERGGSNGASPAMRIALDDIDADALPDDPVQEVPPSNWGELNSHVAHSLAYHLRNYLLRWRYPKAARTTPRSPWREIGDTALRTLMIPGLGLRRRWRKRRLFEDGRPYDLVLLQLRWDASMQRYSPYERVAEVVETCVSAFAAGAPDQTLLVFKTHPLEDGQEGLERVARRAAAAAGLAPDRLRFIDGGKLGKLLEPARAVVTVNSTAGQQALWRGKPVKTLGRAIYDKPGLTSDQSLEAFFAAPKKPDPDAYAAFRRLLLATSQIRGGFYTRQGRVLAVDAAVRAILSPEDRYAPYLRRAGRASAV